MSILEIPRIYFKGEIAFDPITTNNYAVGTAPAAYDENDADASLNNATVLAAQVAAFRQAAVDEIISAGNWNPHGSYRSPFVDTRISGVDTGGGLDLTDPFVGAPVQFTGMLVDAEPYGAISSQLFFDNMSFGIAGGCQIFGQRQNRFHDRYINFQANPNNNMIAGVASVMWQTCFPKDAGLMINPYGSAGLDVLNGFMADTDILGVMVRFCTYRTIYYDDPNLSNRSAASAAAGHTLQNQMAAGGFQPNPARSLLVGTIGLWRRDDAMHEPGDRALLTTSVPIKVSNLPNISPAACGSAWARVGADRITLDLSNCIPSANRAADKVDLGELILLAADPSPADAVTVVGKLPYSLYDRVAYEATSGIIDIKINPALASQLATKDLSLRSANTTYLNETPLRALPDQPNLYLDEGHGAVTTVRVYQRGLPAGAGIAVTMSELAASQPAAVRCITDANGRVSFDLAAKAGGVTGLVFQPGDDPILPVGAAFNTQLFTFMTLRVLPADADFALMPPTWDNVHSLVLSSWQAMAPCMDNWLLLGDAEQVRAFGPLIKKLTDPANFELARFMPITRDMTQGKRRLLYNFLDGSPVDLVPSQLAREQTVTRADFVKLSRAMRGT